MSLEEAIIIRDALDILALALTKHVHKWTRRERRLYEKAVKIIDQQIMEVKNTQLNDAIRHISSLIICPENGSDALRIQRAALDFIYKLE